MDASNDPGFQRPNGARKRHPEQFDRILTDFQVADEQAHVGRLWDLSRDGACMQMVGELKIEENAIGTLKFRQVDTLKEIQVVAEVCWIDSKDRYSLVGLVFGSKLADSDHFLAPYL